MIILEQVFGLVLLIVGVGLGYMKWVRPLGRLDIQKMGALMLVVLTLAGGFIGSWFWWMGDPRTFAWVLPPLAGRMLASAAWSFVVLCVMALQRPTLRRVRLVMLSLFIYLVPLAVVILLFHLDRFNFTALMTYFFFAIVIIITVPATWYLFRPVQVIQDGEADMVPPGRLVKTWLVAQAVLTGIWGLALFITDKGPSSFIWVWPGDLLSSRLVGVMLITIAAGSLYSMQRADSSRQMIVMSMAYSVGLALASLWFVFVGKPVKPAYLILFGLVFIVSATLLLGEQSLKNKPIKQDSNIQAGS